MTGERRLDRGWRRAMGIGIAVSIIAHAALLAWVRFSVDPMGDGESRAELQVVPLPDETDFTPDDPMEVIELADASVGGAATAAGPAPAKNLSLPDVAPIPVAVSEGAPRPVRFLEMLEEKEEEEQPAARYARVSDFLVSTSAEPGPFRPIDDRPVDVLARIGAGRGTGMSVGVGGGHCPPRGGLPLRR
ncbi:MAG: hypothetical protein P8049_01075 [Gemmatimonadota bacterium]|jgi:hypothetical protein